MPYIPIYVHFFFLFFFFLFFFFWTNWSDLVAFWRKTLQQSLAMVIFFFFSLPKPVLMQRKQSISSLTSPMASAFLMMQLSLAKRALSSNLMMKATNLVLHMLSQLPLISSSCIIVTVSENMISDLLLQLNLTMISNEILSPWRRTITTWFHIDWMTFIF